MTPETVQKPSVLFVCVHNAGRSQMAAAFLTTLSKGAIEVRSAGSQPADKINPSAVEAMAEVGIDMSSEIPKVLTTEAVQESDVVEPAAQLLDAAQVALLVGELRGQCLRLLDVVPQVGGGGLLFEFGDLPAEAVDVEDGLDRPQGRVEFVQGDGEVSGHVDPG